MAKKLQLRGGTTSEHSSFTGDVREVTVDTDKKTLVVHDNSTAGGFPLATVNNFESTGIDDNASANAITIETNGDVGIGKTATTKMDVDGTVTATAFAGDGSALTGVSSVSEDLITIGSANQTSFTFTYTAGRIMVFLNGVKLLNTTDFTATNGTSVVLTTGVQTTDKLEFVKF